MLCRHARQLLELYWTQCVPVLEWLKTGNLLCWRHTVPILTPDGHTMKEICNIGNDREDIGSFGTASKPSCVRRLSFLGFGSSFGNVHKIFGMSKNCRRSSRSCTFAWTSCVLLVHRVAIVRPSCVHPVGPCGHRLYFVWPSATQGIFSTRWQYDGHTELADGLEKATRRREAFA